MLAPNEQDVEEGELCVNSGATMANRGKGACSQLVPERHHPVATTDAALHFPPCEQSFGTVHMDSSC